MSCNTPKNDSNSKGWIDLFNGKDLKDWVVKIHHHEVGDNYGNTFRVEDGMVKVRYDQYEKFNERYGHLYFKQPFSHYRLTFEYRFVGIWRTDAPSYTLKNLRRRAMGQSRTHRFGRFVGHTYYQWWYSFAIFKTANRRRRCQSVWPKTKTRWENVEIGVYCFAKWRAGDWFSEYQVVEFREIELFWTIKQNAMPKIFLSIILLWLNLPLVFSQLDTTNIKIPVKDTGKFYMRVLIDDTAKLVLKVKKQNGFYYQIVPPQYFHKQLILN
jgi:hypothetical protein